MVTALIDKSFFNQTFNGDIHQMIIYIQSAIMLANEIIQNSKWPGSGDDGDNNYFTDYHLYGFALQKLHFDFTFEQFNLNNSIQKNSCLAHLFTGKQITNNLYLEKFSVGVSSVATDDIKQSCKQPWEINCILRFANSLVYSMSKNKKNFLDKMQPQNIFSMSQTINTKNFVSFFVF